MKIRDIAFDPEFFTDYDRSPEHVQSRIDKKIINLSTVIRKEHEVQLPNSFNAHKVNNIDGLWIGYITAGNQGWRTLFEVDAAGTLWFLHLLPHDKMEMLLKTLQRQET